MRGPNGGSIHDPNAQLPVPVWDRAVRHLPETHCRNCRSGGKEKVRMHSVSTSERVWYVCESCDGGVWATKA